MRALLRAVSNLLRLLLSPFWLALRALTRPKSAWVELRVAPRLHELPSGVPLWQRFVPRAQPLRKTVLSDVRELCRDLAKDPRVRGLVVHVPPLEAGWAACASLRDALAIVREAGKQVVTYLPQGGGTRELYVALAGQRLAISPAGSISPLGVASGSMYGRTLLERLGVQVEVHATGEYKSAAEPLTRDAMSEPVRVQMEALLGTLHAAFEGALEARGLSAPRRASAFALGLMTAQQARDAGLVDATLYEDELAAWIDPELEKQRATPAARYLQRSRAQLWRPVRAQPYVAVVPVRGTIVVQGVPMGRASAVQDSVITSLREVAADPLARSVILYVNSPGGSALASDLIHREVERLARKKPVVAYFGDVAASGGYYVAAPCAKIVAQPVSITGSIGVITVKPALTGLLERLGVHAQVTKTAPHADMFSITRAYSAQEAEQVSAHAHAMYARFLEVVSSGRKRTVAEVEPHARGRVWSARDALAIGLVDELGGFDRALAQARGLVADLAPEARERLAARVHVARSAEPPPPMAAPAALLQALSLADLDLTLLSLAVAGERVCFYAPDASALR